MFSVIFVYSAPAKVCKRTRRYNIIRWDVSNQNLRAMLTSPKRQIGFTIWCHAATYPDNSIICKINNSHLVRLLLIFPTKDIKNIPPTCLVSAKHKAFTISKQKTILEPIQTSSRLPAHSKFLPARFPVHEEPPPFMILLCSNKHGVSSICYWEDQCLMKKVLCDFFF